MDSAIGKIDLIFSQNGSSIVLSLSSLEVGSSVLVTDSIFELVRLRVILHLIGLVRRLGWLVRWFVGSGSRLVLNWSWFISWCRLVRCGFVTGWGSGIRVRLIGNRVGQGHGGHGGEEEKALKMRNE